MTLIQRRNNVVCPVGHCLFRMKNRAPVNTTKRDSMLAYILDSETALGQC